MWTGGGNLLSEAATAACSQPPLSWVRAKFQHPPHLLYKKLPHDSRFILRKYLSGAGALSNGLHLIYYYYLVIIFNLHAVVEILENLAFLANASNLVQYLSKYMHFSPSKSANNVTNFMGTAFLLALLGGFLSDAFSTTYHVYLISAVIEFLVNISLSHSSFFYYIIFIFLVSHYDNLFFC